MGSKYVPKLVDIPFVNLWRSVYIPKWYCFLVNIVLHKNKNSFPYWLFFSTYIIVAFKLESTYTPHFYFEKNNCTLQVVINQDMIYPTLWDTWWTQLDISFFFFVSCFGHLGSSYWDRYSKFSAGLVSATKNNILVVVLLAFHHLHLEDQLSFIKIPIVLQDFIRNLVFACYRKKYSYLIQACPRLNKCALRDLEFPFSPRNGICIHVNRLSNDLHTNNITYNGGININTTLAFYVKGEKSDSMMKNEMALLSNGAYEWIRI